MHKPAKLFAAALAVLPVLASAAAQQLPPGFAEQVGPAIKQQCMNFVPKDPALAKVLGHAPSTAKVQDFCQCASKTFLSSVTPDEVADPTKTDPKTQAELKQKMQAKLANAQQQCMPRLGKPLTNTATAQ